MNTKIEKESIKELYDAWPTKVINFNSFCKRYERKDRGEDLYRPKYAQKRRRSKSRVDKPVFWVGSTCFKNKATACKENGVKVSTFNARRRRGLSVEEAMKPVPKTDGRRRRKGERRGTEVWVNGRRFPSKAAAARFENKD